MVGFKAFNKDLTCRGYQYEVGKTYSMEEEPIPCHIGFHFCKTIAETYRFYPISDDTRICKVEALGEVRTDDGIKYCTNSIRIVEEITEDWKRKGNSSASNSGYRNSGDYNSGYRNSGDYNSGYRNSGDYNPGDYNSGYRNSGDHNSGYRNSGDYNSGYYNSGDYNSGNHNSGNHNSGDYNSGYYNSGYYNSGDYNSGYYNSGYYNSGYYNSGYYNSGLFNTEQNPKLKMFDKESNWTFNDWACSDAKRILDTCPYNHSKFIETSDMTDKEREEHPEYETTGGFVKTIVATSEDKEKWWNELSDDDKEIIKALPNFDFDKFRMCIGF